MFKPYYWIALAVAGTFTGLVLAAAPDPARWEKEIAAFEAKDRAEAPPKGAVVFAGSSTIRLWTNLPAYFPQWTVIQRGFGGCELSDVGHFADRIIIPYAPAKVVVYGGDNDLAKGRSPQEVLASFRELERKIHAALPRTELYFLAIKPSPKRWHLSPQGREANGLVRRYCQRQAKSHFIDLWPATLNAQGQPDAGLFEPDQLHLNERGYAKWAPIIAAALRR